MAYKLQKGEDARIAAYTLLGNANLYNRLKSPGWDGHPDHAKEGQEFFVDTEVPGPPAAWQADPKRWGRNRGV